MPTFVRPVVGHEIDYPEPEKSIYFALIDVLFGVLRRIDASSSCHSIFGSHAVRGGLRAANTVH
jgi:hypothetical protein